MTEDGQTTDTCCVPNGHSTGHGLFTTTDRALFLTLCVMQDFVTRTMDINYVTSVVLAVILCIVEKWLMVRGETDDVITQFTWNEATSIDPDLSERVPFAGTTPEKANMTASQDIYDNQGVPVKIHRDMQLTENKTILKNYTHISATDVDINVTESYTITSSSAYHTTTPRAIYIRGHRVQMDHSRTSKPDIQHSNGLEPPSAAHNARMNDLRSKPGSNRECWPHCEQKDEQELSELKHFNEDSPNKRDKKHTSQKDKKFHNYKLLFDSTKGDNTKGLRFYAWIFGSGMLALGTLTILSSVIAFCYCGDKWRKRREDARRRGNDKQCEYERVDSVSSIVSHSGFYEDYTDGPVDDVTII